MVASITRSILLIQALVAIGLAALALKFSVVDSIWSGILLGTFSVLLARFAITSNNFILSRIYRSEVPAQCQLTWTQAGKMVLQEFCATMWSSSWTMPFCRSCKHSPAQPTGLPVLLVHGYGCNSGYWNSMSKALARAGISHDAINMEPVFGAIDAYAAVIHEAVEQLCRESGQEKIVIVAHSMGGLAARTYVRDHGTARVARVITLGTPHNGTALASFSIGENGKQMKWIRDTAGGVASPWLRQLLDGEDQVIRKLYVSIYSCHDNIIAPQKSSFLAGAKNIEMHGIGHVALALHPRVQHIVIDEIQRASEAFALEKTRAEAFPATAS